MESIAQGHKTGHNSRPGCNLPCLVLQSFCTKHKGQPQRKNLPSERINKHTRNICTVIEITSSPPLLPFTQGSSWGP